MKAVSEEKGLSGELRILDSCRMEIENYPQELDKIN